MRSEDENKRSYDHMFTGEAVSSCGFLGNMREFCPEKKWELMDGDLT